MHRPSIGRRQTRGLGTALQDKVNALLVGQAVKQPVRSQYQELILGAQAQLTNIRLRRDDIAGAHVVCPW